MADMFFLQAGSPDLVRYSGDMRALIDAEACKLGVANPGTYFAPGNEYVLARQNGRLVAMCVIKRSKLKHATYLGYVLVIVRPEARRGGLMSRMLLLYMLHRLPRLLWDCVVNPRHRVYIYGDINSPIVYAKVAQLKVPIYPNLVHGDTPAEQALGAKLRSEVVAHCDIRNMWHRPGVVRDVDFHTGIIRDQGDFAAPAVPRDDVYRDRHWRTRWHDYVPPNADLLVVIPLHPLTFLGRLGHFLACFAWRGRGTEKAAKSTKAAAKLARPA